MANIDKIRRLIVFTEKIKPGVALEHQVVATHGCASHALLALPELRCLVDANQQCNDAHILLQKIIVELKKEIEHLDFNNNQWRQCCNERDRQMRQQSIFLSICCDKPEDRMYHAADQTWWQRVGEQWKAAERPPCAARDRRIRNEALDEAIICANGWNSGEPIAKEIRALKEIV